MVSNPGAGVCYQRAPDLLSSPLPRRPLGWRCRLPQQRPHRRWPFRRCGCGLLRNPWLLPVPLRWCRWGFHRNPWLLQLPFRRHRLGILLNLQLLPPPAPLRTAHPCRCYHCRPCPASRHSCRGGRRLDLRKQTARMGQEPDDASRIAASRVSQHRRHFPHIDRSRTRLLLSSLCLSRVCAAPYRNLTTRRTPRASPSA